MHILIASDSFKDALPAREVCLALERGIRAALPEAQTTVCPLADGGEGTMRILADTLGLEAVEMKAADPLMRPRKSTYYLSADGQTAFVEMAETAGLQLLTPGERNPMETTTYGVGQQFVDAMKRGVSKFILAIGGSATNDAGMGLATALGYDFLDADNQPLDPIGASLDRVYTILMPSKMPKLDVRVMCDVTNPLFGPSGAAHVYARQKGATDEEVTILDNGLQSFAKNARLCGHLEDPNQPGAGAAGGMGYGCMAFLDARLESGIDLVLDLLGFDALLDKTDLLVTGEGKIDDQTQHGKLIRGLCQRAAERNIPVVAFCGVLEADVEVLKKIRLAAATSINAGMLDAPLEEKLKKTAENLEKTAAMWFKTHDLSQL
ncbi:MAG: glycerate kinase [Saprospiraceae bacterium]|nr:glycerate kinase [Saprospiraceae bacterium]